MTRLLKGIASAYAGRLSAVLATFVLVPLLIARLGLEEFGLYATVAAMGILLSQDFGLAGATTRFVANAHSKSEFHRLRPIVTSSVVFFCSLGAFAAVAVAAFAVYVAGGRGDVTYIALIAAANAFGALFGAVD
ncbi:MAG: oligosaccharide flippase family protein, partial [Actinobacteria bacterium]|nr:oligosaccharide flippase family protein [Actinomycetota bacterium]